MYKGTTYAVLKELRRQNVSELPPMTNGEVVPIVV
jgi:hypothetical protein